MSLTKAICIEGTAATYVGPLNLAAVPTPPLLPAVVVPARVLTVAHRAPGEADGVGVREGSADADIDRERDVVVDGELDGDTLGEGVGGRM